MFYSALTNSPSRSNDGQTLLITSSDGFCSTLSFEAGELGEIYPSSEVASLRNNNTAAAGTPSVQNPSALTPTSTIAPPSPYHGHQHRNSGGSFTAPSPPPALTASFVTAPPHSPARSNSTSSVATQASSAVLTNPPLIGGSVPGLAAANSGKVTAIPATTPPETPRTGLVTGVKREAESEKDEAKETKKRRVAPTPVQDPKA